jgi:hypothetical protein
VSATIKRKLEGMHASVADIIQEAERYVKPHRTSARSACSNVKSLADFEVYFGLRCCLVYLQCMADLLYVRLGMAVIEVLTPNDVLPDCLD